MVCYGFFFKSIFFLFSWWLWRWFRNYPKESTIFNRFTHVVLWNQNRVRTTKFWLVNCYRLNRWAWYLIFYKLHYRYKREKTKKAFQNPSEPNSIFLSDLSARAYSLTRDSKKLVFLSSDIASMKSKGFAALYIFLIFS